MLLTKINVHVLTISISCRHPHKCVVYCCYSVVQSVLLFHCPVYCVVQLCSLFFPVYRIVLLFSYCPVYCVIQLSSLLCYVIFQSIRVYHCPFYCMIMLLSSLWCCSFVWFIVLCYWAVSCVVQFILLCIVHCFVYRVFLRDVTVAILVSQNNGMAAMLVSQTSPVGVEFLSYANAFFCSNKFA